MSSFESLNLPEVLLTAVREAGYETATEVQAQAVPLGLQGADLMVSSRTGSGKTAAFLLPILCQVLARREANPDVLPAFVPRFHRSPARGNDRRGTRGAARQLAAPYFAHALVLAPTRELALQVAQAAQQLGRGIKGFSVATVVGGMPYPAQLERLRGGADLIIATPGRLLDIAGQQPNLLSEIKTLVLDEADRMLDLGFIEDIEAIAAMLPQPRQTVMFSATFDGRVGGLARELLNEPQRIEVTNSAEQKLQIEQRLHWADHPMHRAALLEHLLADAAVDQAVVFASTQIEAEQMAGQLAELGHAVAALHGGMPQGKRNRTLMGLRRRELRVLVATDVAARGIDVPTISHVINVGLPMKAEDYVHRIGRTGRAGRSGLAVTLALREDLPRLRRLQAYTKEALAPTRIEGLEPKKPDPVIFSERGPRNVEGGERRQQWGERKPYGERGGYGDRKPFHGGDRPAFNDRKPFERADRAERPSYGDRPAFGDRKPLQGDRPAFGDRKPFHGDRPAFADRKPFQGDRPAFADRKPFHGDRPAFADRKPFQGDRPAFGDRKPFHGDRPAFADRKPFQGDRPAFADRKPFHGDRPAFADRGGERPARREGGFGGPRREGGFGGPRRRDE